MFIVWFWKEEKLENLKVKKAIEQRNIDDGRIYANCKERHSQVPRADELPQPLTAPSYGQPPEPWPSSASSGLQRRGSATAAAASDSPSPSSPILSLLTHLVVQFHRKAEQSLSLRNQIWKREEKWGNEELSVFFRAVITNCRCTLN